jgi:hypothetical protein
MALRLLRHSGRVLDWGSHPPLCQIIPSVLGPGRDDVVDDLDQIGKGVDAYTLP